MSTNTKIVGFSVKAAGEADGLASGQVRMLVSVFGNVDSYGDVVMPGAFADSLAAWEAKGDPIPFIWSHKWADPFAHIGYVLEAKETDAGLEVLAQLDVDTNDFAKQVFGLLKERRVTQASFAYDTLESEWVEREDAETGAKYEVYELRKLDVLEVGPTLLGANRETELLAAKARQLGRRAEAEAKAGRVLSSKNYEALKDAHTSIGEVLAAAESESDGKSAAGRMGVETTKTGGDSETVDGGVAQARARLLLIEH